MGLGFGSVFGSRERERRGMVGGRREYFCSPPDLLDLWCMGLHGSRKPSRRPAGLGSPHRSAGGLAGL